eukprot:gnl/MRDRNA2_/MRDRNA2_148320_c0_seq1.p1 gnl/MRDRNA2_/MRDRNA2_148320_c0~~gnl/MRDRNA2_/MRDRNA2_148320_c0_seq1.p1  ORF type:complete len:526 (+),score=98.94 gnl/MRDRNA2_/MRDRNA2_148320_c0_seq1:77-1579(+)
MATAATGSLPAEVLAQAHLAHSGDRENVDVLMRTHHILTRLEQHLKTDGTKEFGRPLSLGGEIYPAASFFCAVALGGSIVAASVRKISLLNSFKNLFVSRGCYSSALKPVVAIGGFGAIAHALYSLLGWRDLGNLKKIPCGHGFAGLVGNTPLVELRSLSRATGCRIIAKAEFLNPGGCQKDRVAKRIVEEAEAAGFLRPGGTIVEGTSGSTGISLTLMAASRGLRSLVVMPDDQAAEKSAMLRQFGATVELVRPASIVSEEHYVNVARRRASEIVAEGSKGDAFFADQFENLANFRAHFHGTGPELWSQANRNVDAFVMSSGTGGTIAGVGTYLKRMNPDVQIFLADVQGSSLYSKVNSGVLFAAEQAERTVRRHRRDTIAEGIGIDRLTANFALGLSEHNGGLPCIDGAVRVSDQEALEMAHYLLKHDGLFVGSSAAVNCAAAVKIARSLGPGKVIATVLCDSGLRHLTKFYSPTAWEEYGLEQPRTDRPEHDLSFIF